MNCKIKLIRNTSKMPEFKSQGAAGMDLYADIISAKNDKGDLIAPSGELIVMPGQVVKVPVGFAIAIEPGHVMNILGRSGNELKGIEVKHGTIDEDYRGEICVILKNGNSSAFIINQGDRVAQATIHQVCNQANGFQFELVEELDQTERGEGGFGHTGSN